MVERSGMDAVTALLRECPGGGAEKVEQLIDVLYDELHSMAERQLGGERAGHTLQPTALVNEAFLNLVREDHREWQNRRHFLCAAATAMRRILVNHAVGRRAQKRGGDWQKVPLDDSLQAFEERAGDLLALDDALRKLEAVDEQKSRIVELRFFGGYSMEEIADIQEVATRTVERHWRTARAWLRNAMATAS